MDDTARSRRLPTTDHHHPGGILTRRPAEQRSALLVDSRTNELGLEVAHGTGAHGIEYLHALRCGELVASRLVERHQGRAIGACIEYDRSLDQEQRAAVRLALDEGVRLLRDGRGLGAAA